MKTQLIIFALILWVSVDAVSQEVIPIDTNNWDIQATNYVIENYKGKPSIYLQGGGMTLKGEKFLNGVIEYEIFLKEDRGFPGIYFRGQDNGNAEQFYVRPHQSGNPDANQATALTKNITLWQLHHGDKYSFPYHYKFNEWTQIKILVNGDKAQVFMDGNENPNLSWHLFHEIQEGTITLNGGNQTGMHIANVRISNEAPELKNFKPIANKPIEGLVERWEVSDMFAESLLEDPKKINDLISKRKWQGTIKVEEGTAANISRIQNRFDGSGGNTVFVKITIESNKNQVKSFEFGYSDRVVAILNGTPVYSGTNRFRTRDYRYLGTIGLFDNIYLNLKKGKNELLMAVSEDFGGWLITGRFKDNKGIKVN
ncbi:MAG: hypothetical protein AAFN93_01825 [Bacteroidota bacterium]